MRDNHEGLPELVKAYEREGHYFGVAQVSLGGEPVAYEFGVDEPSYRALRQVFQLRLRNAPDAGSCRYFFVPRTRRVVEGSSTIEFAVRVEQGRTGKQLTAAGPAALVANLMWFFELRSPEAAAHLRRLDSRPEV